MQKHWLKNVCNFFPKNFWCVTSTGVGCHFLLQGIFPTQGSKPGLPHCRQMLYGLSYQGYKWIEMKHLVYVRHLAHYLLELDISDMH